VVLHAPPGYSPYLWDNGSTAATLVVNAPGEYWVIGTGGCTVIDSITVTDNVSLCPCQASFPTAFTPNHDGKDDYFGPLFVSGCIISNYAFSIYNRWGQLVFNSENPNAKWDGTSWYTNTDVGTYMYYLKYTSGPNNILHTAKGDVTLIR
jgi:gliding motility-associated-like protein